MEGQYLFSLLKANQLYPNMFNLFMEPDSFVNQLSVILSFQQIQLTLLYIYLSLCFTLNLYIFRIFFCLCSIPVIVPKINSQKFAVIIVWGTGHRYPPKIHFLLKQLKTSRALVFAFLLQFCSFHYLFQTPLDAFKII